MLKYVDNTVGSLTQTQRSIVIGSLLGDGYLRVVPGRKEALLEINHAYSQKEYVDWKYKMLENLCKSAPKMRKGNGSRVAYRFTTRQNVELTELFRLFYEDKKKVIPQNIKLDSLMLAVWYMDDGSFCRASDVYLNTQQFSADGQNRCQEMLREIGIESMQNRDKEYKRLRFKKSDLDKLWSVITPHIIPPMTYKLGYNPVETKVARPRVTHEVSG